MLSPLPERMRLVSVVGRRSAKAAPRWTRASWARARSEMKMVGRPERMNLRARMGPYLARKPRRMASMEKRFFDSRKMVAGLGMGGGPGGRFWAFLAGKRISFKTRGRRRVRRKMMKARDESSSMAVALMIFALAMGVIYV